MAYFTPTSQASVKIAVGGNGISCLEFSAPTHNPRKAETPASGSAVLVPTFAVTEIQPTPGAWR